MPSHKHMPARYRRMHAHSHTHETRPRTPCLFPQSAAPCSSPKSAHLSPGEPHGANILDDLLQRYAVGGRPTGAAAAAASTAGPLQNTVVEAHGCTVITRVRGAAGRSMQRRGGTKVCPWRAHEGNTRRPHTPYRCTCALSKCAIITQVPDVSRQLSVKPIYPPAAAAAAVGGAWGAPQAPAAPTGSP